MTVWTKQEIEAELKRRSTAEAERDRGHDAAMRKQMEGDANALCIHCGQPFATWSATAGEYGLCDICNDSD